MPEREPDDPKLNMPGLLPAEPISASGDVDELDDEEVPSVVLFVVAGLLLLTFTLYLAAGGGHEHFH